MVTHAAGESGALYHSEEDGRFRGATAVVLKAENEADLNRIEEYLHGLNLAYTTVYEKGGCWDGQFMAIGLVPCDRDGRLAHFPILDKIGVDKGDIWGREDCTTI